jgi:cytochrome c556
VDLDISLGGLAFEEEAVARAIRVEVEGVSVPRRGKMVAVLVSSRNDERLTTGPPDLWAAIQKFRAEHDLSDLDVEEVFANVRDRTPGPGRAAVTSVTAIRTAV